MSKRIALYHEGSTVEARIAMRREWFLLLFLPVWWMGWTLGGSGAAGSLISGNRADSGFLIIWLAGWAVAEVLVPMVWVWNAFGVEVARVGD